MHNILVTRYENIESCSRRRKKLSVAQGIPALLHSRTNRMSMQQLNQRNRHVVVKQNVHAARRDTPGSR